MDAVAYLMTAVCMNRARALRIVTLLILAPVLALSLKILWDSGEFRTLNPVFPECRQVKGVASSEDITIDVESRIAFISSTDRRSREPGNIYSFDLNQPAAVPQPLLSQLPFPFRPQGLSLIRETGGAVFLFVVNHRESESTIERFRWEGAELIHERTYRDPMIHAPNDVAALSRRQFYVSVEGRSQSSSGRLLESWAQLARGYVAFFDGQRFRVAASGFSFSNGVQLSSDHSRLFVAATAGRTITVFRRAENQRLSLEQVLDMGTAVDNLEVDTAGGVWIAAHPKPLRFLWYMGQAGRRSPSEVFRIQIFEQTLYQKIPILVDPEGKLLSASSVAAFNGGRLLIGSVADPQFLDCRVSK